MIVTIITQSLSSGQGWTKALLRILKLENHALC